MALTEDQKEQFLEYVRGGDNRQQAAEKVAAAFGEPDITATRFKFLCGRDHDFNRRFEEARVEGRGELKERLERCAVELALGGNWAALKALLATYNEEFFWMRSSKVEVQGAIDVQAVAGVLAKYLPPPLFEQVLGEVEKSMGNGHDELPPAAGKK